MKFTSRFPPALTSEMVAFCPVKPRQCYFLRIEMRAPSVRHDGSVQRRRRSDQGIKIFQKKRHFSRSDERDEAFEGFATRQHQFFHRSLRRIFQGPHRDRLLRQRKSLRKLGEPLKFLPVPYLLKLVVPYRTSSKTKTSG